MIVGVVVIVNTCLVVVLAAFVGVVDDFGVVVGAVVVVTKAA